MISRSTQILIILLIAIVSLCGNCAANDQSSPAAATGIQSELPKIPFEKYTLPNGLQLILHEDHRLPVVHLNLWFHVGSKNERAGRTEFAHLFEHLMFQGSKDAPGPYITFVEKAGANLFQGGVNGTTGSDVTKYYETVPAGSLEYVLWLESDRLATLADHIDERMLNNQRDVVKNERRQRLENVPYGRWEDIVGEMLYPLGHPYYYSGVRSQEDLNAASVQDVKDFFHKYYTPNNLSLVIAGDFEPAAAKRLVEKYFGGIPVGEPLERPRRWIAELRTEKLVEVHDRVPQERVYLSWSGPPFFAPDEAPLSLSASILSDGLSSRLQKVLVYEKQLATDVVAVEDTNEISGAFHIISTARPGVPLAQIESTIAAEIDRLAAAGPTVAELRRAQTKQEYEFMTELERIGFPGKANLLNEYNTFLGSPDKLAEDVRRYRGVSVGDVKRVVARWLQTPNRLVVRFYIEAAHPDEQIALDRSIVPALGSDPPFRVPEVKSSKLPNGLQLLVVERPDLPKVAVSLFTKAGTIGDPAQKAGVAYLTAKTINRGTTSRAALEIEDSLGDLGTTLVTSAQLESSSLSFDVLKRNLSPAFRIFADVIQHPAFPDAEVLRQRNLQLDELSQEDKDANSLLHRIEPMLAFGSSHPYGRPSAGLPGSVSGLTRDDVIHFHRTYWQPASSALIFVGDISLQEATDLAQKELGGWSGMAPSASIPAPSPIGPGKVFVVDRPGAAQTVLAQILPAPPRDSKDYYALELANAVWGGGFTTRINLNLREDKGYTYGIFSFPHIYTKAGMIAAEGGVQTDKTKESLTELDKELDGIAGGKPISQTELEGARANRVRGYAQEFQSMARLGQKIGQLWASGLPLNELQREPEHLQSQSLDRVNAIARKYANPKYSTLLLIGDYAKIAPGLNALKMGEVVMLDDEGRSIQSSGTATRSK